MTTDPKHCPEVNLGHALKRERKQTTVSPVVNETTLLVELSDPRPGALFKLSENQYIILVNKLALILEASLGENPKGDKIFNRRIFYEAAGTVAERSSSG